MAGAFQDLTEHTGTLIALISFLFMILGLMVGAVWKLMTGIALSLKDDLLKEIRLLRESTEKENSSIWGEIREIVKRQIQIRTDWPKEFASKIEVIEAKHDRVEQLDRIESQVNKVEDKMERFITNCQAGNCVGGRKVG